MKKNFAESYMREVQRYYPDEIYNVREIELNVEVAHRHGIIDVIQILGGKITVFTEEELKSRGDNYEGHREKGRGV